MIKLSLIIPVYNVEDYLGECLESAVNQDYNNYEIIVVNDGSTDGSLKVARKYEKKYSNKIKVFDIKNSGVSAARNYGIKKSTGDYLFFIDSDDCILPNSLSYIAKELDDYDVLVFNVLSGKSLNDTVLISANDSKITDNNKRFIMGKPSCWNKIWKRELFDKIKFPIGLYYEDLAIIPRFAKMNLRIKYVDNALYFYRVRESSIMNEKKYNTKMDSIFEVMEGLKKYFNGEYEQEIEYLYIDHLLRSASLRYFDCGVCNYQLDKIVSIIRKEYPNWKKNKYFKRDNIKKKVICYLFYHKCYMLIKFLRK